MYNASLLFFLAILSSNCVYRASTDDFEGEEGLIISEEPVSTRSSLSLIEPDKKPLLDEYYHNIIRDKYNFTFEDYIQLEQISKKKSNIHLKEAILAAGIFHRIKLYRNQKQTSSILQNFSPGSNPNEAPPYNNDLAQLEKLYGIDLIDTLEQNRFVNNLHLFNLALTAISSMEEKTYRSQVVLKAVKHKLKYWQFISQKFFPEKDLTEPTDNYSEIRLQPDEETGIKAPLPFENSDLSKGEELILEVDSLVEQNEYHKAILLLEHIREDSPLYSTVLEKKKQISNAGVTDLRKKAAKAFQSAIPVTDHKARTAYLQKAKEYLEEASRLYPNSDYQKSVEENLNIINRNIEIIQYEDDS